MSIFLFDATLLVYINRLVWVNGEFEASDWQKGEGLYLIFKFFVLLLTDALIQSITNKNNLKRKKKKSGMQDRQKELQI